MTPPDFAAEARSRSDGLWRAIHGHPFVRGIGDGTLSRDRFEFYLRQDYAYLVDFARVLSLAAAKADSLEEMRFFAGLAQATLDEEMELHRRTCADLGIDAGELERTQPALVTSAYTAFLLRACYEGPLADIVAVLTPCAAGYVEVAERLRDRGLPDDPHYRDWIETYASADMVEVAGWLGRQLDRHAAGSSLAERDRWRRLYETSTRFELLFFQMAWERSSWPECVPA